MKNKIGALESILDNLRKVKTRKKPKEKIAVNPLDDDFRKNAFRLLEERLKK